MPVAFFTLKHDLLSEFAKIHGLFELPQGNSAVQKIVSESKIAVVRTITDQNVRILIRNRELFQKISLRLSGQFGRDLEFAVLQKNSKPMQNTVSSPAKPEHAETIRIQLIAVQKTVSILIDAPFPRCAG